MRTQRKDFAALLRGAAKQWLSRQTLAGHGERVTVLVANPALNDAASADSVVVLQPGESEGVGVTLDHAGVPALLLWRPGELAEALERGLWLKVEVPDKW